MECHRQPPFVEASLCLISKTPYKIMDDILVAEAHRKRRTEKEKKEMQNRASQSKKSQSSVSRALPISQDKPTTSFILCIRFAVIVALLPLVFSIIRASFYCFLFWPICPSLMIVFFSVFFFSVSLSLPHILTIRVDVWQIHLLIALHTLEKKY